MNLQTHKETKSLVYVFVRKKYNRWYCMHMSQPNIQNNLNISKEKLLNGV